MIASNIQIKFALKQKNGSSLLPAVFLFRVLILVNDSPEMERGNPNLEAYLGAGDPLPLKAPHP